MWSGIRVRGSCVCCRGSGMAGGRTGVTRSRNSAARGRTSMTRGRTSAARGRTSMTRGRTSVTCGRTGVARGRTSMARGRAARRTVGGRGTILGVRTCHGGIRRPSVILRKSRRPVKAGAMLVRSLHFGAFNMMVALGEPLPFARSGPQPAGAVETGAHSAFYDRRAIDVDIVKAAADMHDSGVVAEHAAGPDAAQEADAGVSKSVVDATVESDVRTPISRVPYIDGSFKSPVSRRPQ
jgi:hypothetical protein